MTLVNNFKDTAQATPPSLWPTNDSGFTLLVMAAGHDEDDILDFLEQHGVLSVEEDSHDGLSEIDYDCPLVGVSGSILDEVSPDLREQFKDYLDERFEEARDHVDAVAACVAALEESSSPKMVAHVVDADDLKWRMCSLNCEDMAQAIVTTFGNLDVAENDVVVLLVPSRQMVERYAEHDMSVDVVYAHLDKIDGAVDAEQASSLASGVFEAMADDFSGYIDDLREGLQFMMEACSDLKLLPPDPRVLETHGQMRLIP